MTVYDNKSVPSNISLMTKLVKNQQDYNFVSLNPNLKGN